MLTGNQTAILRKTYSMYGDKKVFRSSFLCFVMQSLYCDDRLCSYFSLPVFTVNISSDVRVSKAYELFRLT